MHCCEALRDEGIELVLDVKLDLRDEYDGYLFHRFPTAKFFPVVQRLKDAGKVIVWETDDLLTDIPASNPARHSITDADLERYEACLDLADWIIVTTPQLAKEMNRSNVLIGPNLIDLSAYPAFKEQDKEDVVRILWAGGGSHEEDLDMIAPALAEIKNEYGARVEIGFFGYLPTLTPFAHTFHPFVGLGEYIPRLTELQPHIGLAPLVDNRFNRCRSPIKYLEYTGVNAVTVASDLEPYHGIVGAMVGDWDEAIGMLVDDLELRNEMLMRARRDVEVNHSWREAKKETWIEFIRTALIGLSPKATIGCPNTNCNEIDRHKHNSERPQCSVEE